MCGYILYKYTHTLSRRLAFIIYAVVDLDMPMYDYKCKKCGHEFENLVSFSIEDKDVECPSCNNKGSKRLLCAPNISTNANGGSSKSSGNASSGFS